MTRRAVILIHREAATARYVSCTRGTLLSGGAVYLPKSKVGSNSRPGKIRVRAHEHEYARTRELCKNACCASSSRGSRMHQNKLRTAVYKYRHEPAMQRLCLWLPTPKEYKVPTAAGRGDTLLPYAPSTISVLFKSSHAASL